MKQKAPVKTLPAKSVSPVGETDLAALETKPALLPKPVPEPVTDPFAGILPSREELARLRQKAEEAQQQAFREKLPVMLRHIAQELRQGAAKGENPVTIDMGRFAVWLETHQKTLATYLKQAGCKAQITTHPYAVVVDISEQA